VGRITLPHNYTPRLYQLDAWKHFQGPQEGKRGVAVWHRRAGKDLFAINMIQTKVIERVGLYWHMLPTYKQGRSIVWNGKTREGRPFLDHFHPDLVETKRDTDMLVRFQNGSIYQVVGTDDIDSLVGTNPVGVVFSEYSLHDPGAWDYIRPILAENGGWALFIYTARGKNHGYKMLNMSKANRKWFSQVLVAGNQGTKREDGTPVISDEVIQEERDSGMDEHMIQQEFYCSFEAPMVGSYYGTQMARAEKENRICNVPHETKLMVDTYWDLGVADSTTIWFVQTYGMESRIINYYENSGEGLAHYAKVLKGQVQGMEICGEYTYGRHYAPHDIEVREFTSGKSRIDAAKSMGIKFSVVKQHEVEDGIEQVRNILGQCWFDEKNCEKGISALRSYRKEYDEKKKTFKNNPLHDWSSHGADAFRMFAMGKRERKKYDKKPQERAMDDHDYLNAKPAYEPVEY
jgi:phage terminase large subunit